MAKRSSKRRSRSVLFADCDIATINALQLVASRRGVSVAALLRDAAEAIVVHGGFLGPLIDGLKHGRPMDAATAFDAQAGEVP